jgi:soluble lytic murein transglycosylase-like protein
MALETLQFYTLIHSIARVESGFNIIALSGIWPVV